MIDAQIKKIDNKAVRCDLKFDGSIRDVIEETGVFVDGVIQSLTKSTKKDREFIKKAVFKKIIDQLEGE